MSKPGKILTTFALVAALAACGTAAQPAAQVDTGARAPVHLYATPDLTATTVPIDATSGTLMVDAQTLTIPAVAGDMLDVHAYVELSTSGIPGPLYTIGVGYHLWAQRTGLPLTRLRISPYVGVNITEPTPHGHYAEPVAMAVWTVPDGWTGNIDIIGVVDAMSTAARTPPDLLQIRTGYSFLEAEEWR